MSDSHQPSTGLTGGGPPPPGWLAPTPPWAAAQPAPEPPAPPRQADSQLTWGRASVALAVTAGLLVGALGGIATRWRWRGQRPTLSTASPGAPSGPAAPFAPVPLTPSTPNGNSQGRGSSTGGAGLSGQTAAAAARVSPGIVDINTRLGYRNGAGAGAGTGMILDTSGDILTNNHVIEGATTITVTLVDTGRSYTAAVVGTDPTDDVAVIRIPGASGLKPIPIGDSSAVAPGDSVIAMGNAGGAGGAPAVVTGTVQAVNRTITAGDPGIANSETLTGLIQTDAPLQPGDSGGPLVNSAGQVIGMNTAASAGRRFQTGASVGFAIPVAHALSVARQIESGQATTTVHIGVPAILGVSIDPAAANARGGATIAGAEPGLPAARAGLAAGDTITSIDGRAVDSAQSLSSLTKSHRPGDRVTVSWTDGSGGHHSAPLTLVAGPPD